MPNPRQRADIAAWILLPIVVLCSLDIGMVSGDGISQASRYLNGTWSLNPNHLLYEPLGALWLIVTEPLAAWRSGPDSLKLLSILAGGVCAGVFRALAGEVFSSRSASNFSTAALVLCSGFLVHLTSDETHMVQMPWLALFAWSLVRLSKHPNYRNAIAAGASGGAASLWYVSNVAIAALAICSLFLFLRPARTTVPRSRLLLASGAAGCALMGVGFALAWRASGASDDIGFSSWLTSYAGGTVDPRVASAYGISADWRSLAASVARAAFGVASLIVDQTSLASQVRGEQDDLLRVLLDTGILLAVLCATGAVLVKHRKSAFPVIALAGSMVGWSIGVILFAIAWNNSDAQFFFQLSIPFALLMGWTYSTTTSPSFFVVASLALVWNLVTFVRETVRYPRAKLIAEIDRITSDAALVILPGHEPIEHLVLLEKMPKERRISITDVAEQYPKERGLAVLDSAIKFTLGRGQKVVAIRIVGANSRVIPWKKVEKFGYSLDDIQKTMLAGRAVKSVSTPNISAHQIELRPRQ